MDWAGFVAEELNKPSIFDSIELVMADSVVSGKMSPVVRLSISLFKKFLEIGEKHLVIVFPEGKKLPFLFLVAKLLADVFEGDAEVNYDPDTFSPGQKLKFQKYVLEFVGMEKDAEGITRICLKTRDDVTKKIPTEWAPFFQQTDTNRHLSKDYEVSTAFKEFRIRNQSAQKNPGNSQIVETLANNITHFTSTVFSVASARRIKELLDTTTINHEKLSKLLLIGRADYEGNIDIKGAGQLTGNPAMVYAADLYSVLEAVKKEIPVKLLLIDGTNQSTVTRQLDALDELVQLEFPIVYTTATGNSFELDDLEKRGFYIWRWDESTLTEPMLLDNASFIGMRVLNCAKRTLQYIKCDSNEIDNAVSALMNTRQLSEEANANYSSSYTQTLSLAFRCMRAVKNFGNNEHQRYLNIIKDVLGVINVERKFNPVGLSSSMENASRELSTFLGLKGDLPKVAALKQCIEKNRANWTSICLIIPDDADREGYINFWQRHLLNNHIGLQIHIARQDEYIHDLSAHYDATIVCGWIRREKMQQILYSNISGQYIVLLYGYETRWKNAQVKWWSRTLHKSDAEAAAARILSWMHIQYKELDMEESGQPTPDSDELEEISLIIQKSQYRNYIASGGTREFSDTIEAVPISFVGNCFAFFKPNHKLIDVTDIILSKKSSIRMIDPESLDTGNFIVVREASKDIIRELADEILSNSGMAESRELAAKWKDALEMEGLFSDADEICRKIQSAGCRKNIFTIRQWIKNEDRIIPQDKEDLKYIAIATEDSVLAEKLDEVYEAGKNVQRAHIRAGQALSERLKQQVAEKLTASGIDPYNIWDPITLYIEGIGNVKILKVIDKGSIICVDALNVNRIIEES